jgi:hypothetical protein
MRSVYLDIVTNTGAINAWVDSERGYRPLRRLDLTQGDVVEFSIRFFSKSGLTYTRVDLGATADVDVTCRNIIDMFGDPLFSATELTRTADGANWKWVGTADLDTVRIANSIEASTKSVDGQLDITSSVSGNRATYANIPTRVSQSAFGLDFDELDVSFYGLADNDLLQYNYGTTQWERSGLKTTIWTK